MDEAQNRGFRFANELVAGESRSIKSEDKKGMPNKNNGLVSTRKNYSSNLLPHTP